MARLIAAPPAMHDDDAHPDRFHEHDVEQRWPSAFVFSKTLPPSLITVILSRKRRIQPRASIRTSAF